ncbi:MAG TPA: lysylphosphatidylglycerol synthase transmembrane domain-containing protein [Candidatus Saccharimonadia bacterium]|nr:lysylphosphatidylglycerol synthase transmembrane domain-containing protein [Candidatus Saccharimonadia bacterium]
MKAKINKTNWRLILTVITIVALAAFIIFSRSHIISAIESLHKVDLWALSLIIPVELLNYYAQTRLYQDCLRSLGYKLSKKFLFKFSLELNFIATVFPSAGISALSYTNIRLKSKSVSRANASLVHLVKTINVFLSFLILLSVGLFLLALGGRASSLVILFAGIIVTILVFLSISAVYLIASKERIDSFFTFVTVLINRIIYFLRPNVQEAINVTRAKRVFSELHDGYLIFRNDMGQLKRPFMWGLLANFTEVLALYVVYIAFGHWVNPGAIILAYAIANFGGFLSVLPGGAGVYETLMTIVLAAAGIPPSESLPITIMYRIANTGIQIVPGYFYYQRALTPEDKI